jgi:hypothetical protein
VWFFVVARVCLFRGRCVALRCLLLTTPPSSSLVPGWQVLRGNSITMVEALEAIPADAH